MLNMLRELTSRSSDNVTISSIDESESQNLLGLLNVEIEMMDSEACLAHYNVDSILLSEL